MEILRSAVPLKADRGVLVGLIGMGIEQSRSSGIHEMEAAALGFPLVYKILDFDTLRRGANDIPRVLDWARTFGFAGLNVTHPFKKRVIPFLDALSTEATALEAVNTIVFADGAMVGHNTDWSGYGRSFTAALPDVALGRVAQMGAGGAGSAVSYALLKLGVGELVIFDVDKRGATHLAHRLAGLFPDRLVTVADDVATAVDGTDGLVQTSPIGMTGHPGSPVDPALLRPAQWVSDIIYFPADTELLRAARAIGCRTINGEGMVVQQAADAFALFTGRTPDIGRMLDRFDTEADGR